MWRYQILLAAQDSDVAGNFRKQYAHARAREVSGLSNPLARVFVAGFAHGVFFRPAKLTDL